MRILYLNHNVARRGGTFYRAYDLGRHLVQRGHSVTLLTISAGRRWGFEHEVSDGVELVHSPDLLWGVGRTGWDPWDTANRIGFLRGQAWDVVHAWDSRPVVALPALYARQQSHRAGGKLVMDWCDWFGRGGTQAERSGRMFKQLYGPVETYFEEAFRTRPEGTTVISQALFDRAVGLGVPAGTIRLVYQGCDLNGPPLPGRQTAREKLGLPADRPLVLTVGVLLKADARLLFDSLRCLFGLRPDCRVVMVGRHGAEVPEDLRASGQVAEAGFVPDETLRNYMAACDALLTPLGDTLASRARWPSKINPFLAAGRAVVMTRVGDLARLLEARQAAVVADCQPEDIAMRLAALLADPGRRAEVERRARQVAEAELAWPLITERLEHFYRAIRGEAE